MNVHYIVIYYCNGSTKCIECLTPLTNGSYINTFTLILSNKEKILSPNQWQQYHLLFLFSLFQRTNATLMGVFTRTVISVCYYILT